MTTLFHKCGPACAPHESHHASGAGTGRKRPFTIDFHCHAFVPEVEALVKDYPQKKAEPELALRMLGQASVDYNNQTMLPAAGPKLVNLETRLAEMDAMGVDLQVVSPTSTQHYYWAEPELAREVVRLQNERIAEICAAHPDRLQGLGNVALQHADLSVEQLIEAHRLGLKGVEVSTSVNGKELSDPAFARFWAKAEELGSIVFIHPFGTSLGERVNQFYLQNIIGQPIETTIALSYLIFSGTLDRHPGIRIVAAHGGGYLPHYIGRSDHGWQARADARTCQHPPSEYLKRIWFDSLVYEPESVRHLINVAGVSQVVLGTDWPFDMGHYDVHELINAIPGLSDSDRAAILGGNAAGLLGLDIAALLSGH